MALSCVVRYQEHTAVNASLPYAQRTARPDISRSAGLAEGSPVRAGRLRNHRGLSQAGNLRLCLQMRRAAVSIPANIAEGFRRRGKADKARFMNMAEGSIEECRYYLILAKDLGYGDTARSTASWEEVSRLLSAYTTAILSSASRLP